MSETQTALRMVVNEKREELKKIIHGPRGHDWQSDQALFLKVCEYGHAVAQLENRMVKDWLINKLD